MQVHIVLRYRRYGTIGSLELVSVFEKKKDASDFAKQKNNIHEALSPYIYYVATKKVVAKSQEQTKNHTASPLMELKAWNGEKP